MAQDLRAPGAVETAPFADRLAAEVERKRSQLLVGLDPRPELLPVELRGEATLGREGAAAACARFCRGLVDAVAPYVVGVKPQVAFFEALGPDGLRAFEEVCAYARAAGLLVLADGKRGDVASTARAYASGAASSAWSRRRMRAGRRCRTWRSATGGRSGTRSRGSWPAGRRSS